jgi:hypothetical protein
MNEVRSSFRVDASASADAARAPGSDEAQARRPRTVRRSLSPGRSSSLGAAGASSSRSSRASRSGRRSPLRAVTRSGVRVEPGPGTRCQAASAGARQSAPSAARCGVLRTAPQLVPKMRRQRCWGSTAMPPRLGSRPRPTRHGTPQHRDLSRTPRGCRSARHVAKQAPDDSMKRVTRAYGLAEWLR